jgi:hypothetical protein
MDQFSASIAESGLDNIGQVTWRNALEYAEEYPLLTTPEQIEEARDYFADFGAWEDDEIQGWDENTINALLVQDIAANIREMEHYDTLEEFFQENGRLGLGDNGEWYFYVGM